LVTDFPYAAVGLRIRPKPDLQCLLQILQFFYIFINSRQGLAPLLHAGREGSSTPFGDFFVEACMGTAKTDLTCSKSCLFYLHLSLLGALPARAACFPARKIQQSGAYDFYSTIRCDDPHRGIPGAASLHRIPGVPARVCCISNNCARMVKMDLTGRVRLMLQTNIQ